MMQETMSVSVLDTIRRYLKSFFYGFVILLFILLFVGSLSKLYEITGLKDWRKRRASSTDDHNFDGGSARSLIFDSDNRAESGESDEDVKTTPRKGKQFPMAVRRQQANSDSESGATGSVFRAKSERKLEEVSRRARTMSENGATAMHPQATTRGGSPPMQPVDRDGSKVSDTSQPSLARQPSLSRNANYFRQGIEKLGSSMSEPLPLQTAPRKNGTLDVIDDADNELTSSGRSHNVEMLHESSEKARFSTNEEVEIGVNKRNRRGRSKLRYCVTFIVAIAALGYLLIVACSETWLNDATCRSLKLLVTNIQSQLSKSSPQSAKSAIKAGSRLSDAVRKSFEENNLTSSTLSFLGSLGETAAVSMLGVCFVLLVSCSFLCQRSSKSSSTAISQHTSEPDEPVRDRQNKVLLSPISTARSTSLESTGNDYVNNLAIKLRKRGFDVFKCDTTGVELPAFSLNRNIIDQSALFCLVVSEDKFLRLRCVEEIKWAFARKPSSELVVILLDNASIDNLPVEVQHAIQKVSGVTWLKWPSQCLKRPGGEVLEEEHKSMSSLCELIQNSRSSSAIWDVYISHPWTLHQRDLVLASPVPNMVTSLASIVAAVDDSDSQFYLAGLIQSLVSAQSITSVEGGVLSAVLQGKAKDTSRLDASEIVSMGGRSAGSVEPPYSPGRLGDDDASTVSGEHLHQYRHASAETARSINLAKLSD